MRVSQQAYTHKSMHYKTDDEKILIKKCFSEFQSHSLVCDTEDIQGLLLCRNKVLPLSIY